MPDPPATRRSGPAIRAPDEVAADLGTELELIKGLSSPTRQEDASPLGTSSTVTDTLGSSGAEATE